jgi:opacity protein-like surface antigen
MRLLLSAATLSALLAMTTSAFAEAAVYVKAFGGYSSLGSTEFGQTDVAAPGARGRGEFDSGWYAGAALGYRYEGPWSAEIAWVYRTNDNDRVAFSDGTVFEEGNFASNMLFVNGYYRFDRDRRVTPYVGAGLGWVQEIDLDEESGGVETSYAGDGDVAGQIVGGLEIDLGQRWTFQGELRYLTLTGVDLEEESGSARLLDADYQPWSAGFGFVYRFGR